MEINTAHLPVRYAKLIIRYTHNLLSEKEKVQLDEWLTESDDNLEIYEELLDGLHDNIFDPDSLIIETEDALDVWMIAALIAKQMQKIITRDEKKRLKEWIEASERNRVVYRSLTNTANLQKFVVWFKQWMQKSISPTGLN